MFDVSWGETFVIIGLSVALVGRKDLPNASKFLGDKVGRVVGLLQGARLRADTFAAKNDLHALQNELRSGLRELDQVKGELAIAASSRGMVGRGLGSTIPGSTSRGGGPTIASTTTGSGNGSAGLSTNLNAINPALGSNNTQISGINTRQGVGSMENPATGSSNFAGSVNMTQINTGREYLEAARMNESNMSSSSQTTLSSSPLELAPRSQSVAAVAEEEWEKQGIGFKSKAESGTGYWQGSASVGAGSIAGASGQMAIGGGSTILADVLQQNLIWDQHDRAVMEQDQALQSRVDKARAKAKEEKKSKT